MKNNKGFTLIEMIVSIAIVSVMATIAIIALNPVTQFQKANDARRKSDLSQIQKALETYYGDAQRYPDDNSSGSVRYIIMNGVKTTSCSTPPCQIAWGGSWQPYINLVPKDPGIGRKYSYYSPDGQRYCLYASLEKIPSAGTCNSALCDNVTACGSAGKCNFAVCSPNQTP